MWLSRIEPDEPGHDKRTFECPSCEKVVSEIVKYRWRFSKIMSLQWILLQGRRVVKLVTEYLTDAIKFDQMADDATDVALKTSFRKQAAEYRKLALNREPSSSACRRQPFR
jgi:hypothetical protein